MEIFKGFCFFLIPSGFGQKRIEFFETRIGKLGGTLVKDSRKATHVLVEDSLCLVKEKCSAALRSHGLEGRRDVKCLSVKWVSECLARKGLAEEKPFEIEWEGKGREEEEESSKEEQVEGGESGDKRQKIDNEKYICSKASSSNKREQSQMKKKIVEELEKLANAYSIRNDTWRSHGYRKAINAIITYEKDITTFQEAQSIPGIGEKMALKIMEIIESGELQKVKEIVDEKTKVLDAFCKIWGVGPSTAEAWYLQGFRTIEDLKARGKLTKQQQIGLKLYEDLQERIPREEVVTIAGIVEAEIRRVGDGALAVEVVGSFRRGKPTCGDIDLMVVNPGPKSPTEILIQTIGGLKSQGYITDDLVTLEDLEDSQEENHHKYMGVFKLPGEHQTHRRIDLFVVPKSEYASALMHYTGSALFNRSIRLLATKKEMTLTEHGLYAGTTRKGSEVTSKGQLVPTLTEEDIFKELGLPYRHPEERDH